MKRTLSILLCLGMLLALMPMLTQTVSAESLSKFNIRLDEPIASYTPDFSPVFNTNTTVYSSVTWQENSPGFSAKLNSSDEFKAGLAYKVDIWIRLGDGNYFPVDGYGDLATAITVNGKAISSLKINDRNGQNQITEVTITCEYDPLPGREISSVLITGVPTPVAGNMPIYSFTVGSSSYSYYHTAPVVWWDMTTGQEMDSSDTFIQGHKYQLNIWLQANRAGGFTFKTDQSGNPQVSATINSWAADSVTKAYEQDGREVIDIRYTFPACKAAHTCTPDYWHYNAGEHYSYCTECGEMLNNEDHKGGVATCEADGKCTVCGYAYIKASEDYHVPDTSKWVARGDMYHFHKCSICGAHCDIEEHRWSPKYHPVNASGHAYQCVDCQGYDKVQPHNSGPAATETTPQTCKDCGYIIEPAKNHQHDLTKVPQTPATCTQEGNIEYYVCTGCNDCFTDAEGKNKIPETTSVQVGALGHTASESWSYDEQYHWRSCDVCKVILDETKMHHEFAEGVCTTCGYKEGAQVEPTEETESAQPTEPEKDITPNQDPKGPNWMLIILVGLICFGAATTVAVICLKKKK